MINITLKSTQLIHCERPKTPPVQRSDFSVFIVEEEKGAVYLKNKATGRVTNACVYGEDPCA